MAYVNRGGAKGGPPKGEKGKPSAGGKAAAEDPWAKGGGKGAEASWGKGAEGDWGKGADPWGKGADPWGKGAEKGWGKGADPWGKGADPWGKGADPWGKGADPWGKGADPWGKGADPWGKGADPWGKGADPWGKGADPWGKGADPWGKGADPWGKGGYGPAWGPDPWAGYYGKGGPYDPYGGWGADPWGKGYGGKDPWGAKGWDAGKGLGKPGVKGLGKKDQSNNPKSEKLFVGNLPDPPDEEAIRELFQQYGEVVELKMMYYESGKSKGFCFVSFESTEIAEAALYGTNVLEGRTLEINFSSQRFVPGSGGGKVIGSGMAEVRFDDPALATQAFEMLNGSALDGCVITITPQSSTKMVVTGLSPATQWQELKDHFKKVGTVAFCDIKPASAMGGMAYAYGSRAYGTGADFARISRDVEAFLNENSIDDRAAEALRHLPPQAQSMVLSKGALKGAQNPSSALMVRIKATNFSA